MAARGALRSTSSTRPLRRPTRPLLREVPPVRGQGRTRERERRGRRPVGALCSAMVWAFLLLLTWQVSGPGTVGVGLFGALLLVNALIYLWPALPHRLLVWASFRDGGDMSG